MDLSPDLMFVIGVFAGALAIPSLLSAFSESRVPRMAALLFIVCIGSVGYAVSTNPTGYSIAEAPSVIMRVLSGNF
ncbi:MAG: hypothetical protein AAFQ66_04380 [Pseudomonadota bacterium]